MPKAPAAPPELPFDPALPYPVPIPWDAPWDRVLVVYDLYKCELWLDDEFAVVAAGQARRRALLAQLTEIEKQPDGDAKNTALNAWTQAQRAYARARATTALCAYVLRVEWPDGSAWPGTDPATWAKLPLELLEWLTTTGYTQARNGLWHSADPKAPPPPVEPPPASS